MSGWVTSTASRKGDRRSNQDQALAVEGAIAVLDGATSWLPQDPAQDGGWYARMLGARLTRDLPGHQKSLPELLADAIAEIRDTYALQPASSPYSTAAIVRWNADTVEALVLGDSPVLVEHRDGVLELLADERLEPIAADLREAYRQRLRAGHGFDAEFATLIADVQTVERKSRNQEGGFWVAGADPNAAGHAVQRSWPAAEIRQVLVMSDGVSAGVLDYEVVDWAGLLDLVGRRGPAEALALVHRAEQGDPDGRRWPRTKCHDDKTIAVLARENVEDGRHGAEPAGGASIVTTGQSDRMSTD